MDEYRLDHTIDLDYILSWWKQNRNRFPSLSDMVRDILSIPITTVAFESCFSMGGQILIKWKSSLKPENAEALVATRNWLFGYKIDGGKFYEHIFLSLFSMHVSPCNNYINFTCKYLMWMRMTKSSMVNVFNFLKLI